jgi:serine/threonine-protein kinase
MLGTVVSDRYEIQELLTVGGMARIYRAIQRSLNRPVVVKVVDPELLSGDEETADEATQRFMVEAQAASRLNHPNVVSVIDFGRAAESEGGYLFLVMEYLAGRDLRTVLNEDWPLGLPRIASILRQTLAALVEAHFVGITHRDVKPDNIILEARRRGDHVKVIDFGLAKLGNSQSVTRVGKTLGTPHYMAPEQIRGDALGSGDIYAVGVILYEMLTGEVPFDGETPLVIMQKHVSAARPDPRVLVPDIPEELAQVCMRAMALDAADRFPSAEAFADALEAAIESPPPSERFSLTGVSLPPPPLAPPRPSMPPPVTPVRVPPRPGPAPEVEVAGTGQLTSGPELVGRDADVAWGCELLENPDVAVVLFTGPPGIGRTRMLDEIAACAELEGATVVRAEPPPRPRQEIGFSTLRAVLLGLTGESSERLASGAASDEALVGAGLRSIFADEVTKGPSGPVQTRRGVAHALAWALELASRRASGAHVVLVVDDLDRVDGVSRQALADVTSKPLSTPWKLVAAATGAVPGLPSGGTATRALGLLSIADAQALAASLRRSAPLDRPVEPLFVTLAARWAPERSGAMLAPELEPLVEWRISTLKPAARRVLLAAAVIGAGTVEDLAALTRPNDVDDALDSLVAQGLVMRTPDEEIAIAHEIFGRVVLGVSPSGAIEELRKKCADAIGVRDGSVELRAFHAIRTQPDFETFMLVENAAALRSQRGDDAGAIAILGQGLSAGHTLVTRGDEETGRSACVIFGQKLATSLGKVGEHGKALAVLEEVLVLLAPNDPDRLTVLDELARIALRLGDPKADVFRREAANLRIKRKPIER